MKRLLLTTCCLVAATSGAMAQTNRSSFPTIIRPKDSLKTSQEAAKVLEKAKASGIADQAKKLAEKPQVDKMTQVAAQGKASGATKTSPAENTETAASKARLADAMTRLAPEGRVLLAQSATSPAMRAPDDAPVSSPAVKASPLTSGGAGPKPQPLRPTPLDVPEKTPEQKTIVDAGSSFFDSRQGFGVFVDNVVLNHPSFHLTCDELQVYMNKEEEDDSKADPKKTAAGAKPPTASELAASGAADSAGESKEKKDNGNLKRAIAKGRKVLINKMSDKGVPQTGIGREADYDGATGDMILRGWPQMQEGQNLTVATEPTTYFVIKANGQFTALGGRCQTRIIQGDEKKGPKAAGVTPAAAAPGAPPSPVINTRTQGGQ